LTCCRKIWSVLSLSIDQRFLSYWSDLISKKLKTTNPRCLVWCLRRIKTKAQQIMCLKQQS
jgi:hypothetical protein